RPALGADGVDVADGVGAHVAAHPRSRAVGDLDGAGLLGGRALRRPVVVGDDVRPGTVPDERAVAADPAPHDVVAHVDGGLGGRRPGVVDAHLRVPLLGVDVEVVV